MNSSLLNPIWFYLIELFNRFGRAFAIIGILALIGGGVAIFISMMEMKDVSKCVKKIMIIGAIVLAISGIIPSEKTCYKMIVASYVTPANIESVRGEVIDLIDYIIEKVDGLTDNEESD